MTRAMCSRTSKRKNAKLALEILEDCKENSPCITTSQKKNYRKQGKTSPHNTNTQNNLVKVNHLENSSSVNEGILRKSERQRKSPVNNKDFVYSLRKSEVKVNTSIKRNVLGDKTNSPLNGVNKTTTSSEPTQTSLNRRSILPKLVNTSTSNAIIPSNENSLPKPHIPVYKTIDSSNAPNTSCANLLPEKKAAVYEFDEVDENEEPVVKKKKKRKVNARKPKMGPKALTINNIKYSSTESLASLPEKPVRQRKNKTKMVKSYVKPCTSMNDLNSSESTSYSVKSFMSHPPSILLCDRRDLNNRHELSVLQETQSENCQSPIHVSRRSSLKDVDKQPVISSNSVRVSTALPNNTHSSQNNSTVQNSSVSQLRCYPSKKSISDLNIDRTSHCASVNENLPDQISLCSANISTRSSHDFLSSTPCKRTSLVVRQNSVFDDSYERDIPTKMRPSTGYIKDASENMVIDDNCFGFDEPEELEEPLVSPIKNINLQEPRVPNWRQQKVLPSSHDKNTKPDLKEVIEILKASLPKAKPKEQSQVFNSDSSSTEHSNTPSPKSKEVETTFSTMKPPRRSYERQRRVRYNSEHEEDEDEEEEENNEENDERQQKQKKHDKSEQGNTQKPTNKCYQKKNVSKVFKAPHVPKAKQRMLKEEEELERLAAQMNAQFQAIEKCNLVVE